ncbi:MAG: class I SAM-dependent methyltransferase [Gallionella sp.]|nr:class I SAM-dependent methyltransferase [Gallionella sp.]
MKLASPPESTTHLHLLSVLVTEIVKKNLTAGRVRILDSGCGNGHFSSFMHLNLTALFPNVVFEIHGYDVADHGVQAKDYFSKTLSWCKQHSPDVQWEDRLKLITHDQSWPFESSFFDFVLSNQVLEHVWDHQHFFSEHSRVLKKGGSGVHLFPLKHYIYEGHLLIPFVHRISDWYLLKTYIKLMNKIGIGAYQKGQVSLEEYSEKHADYMTFYTNYLSYSELMRIVKQAQLRPSLKYTVDYYLHKLRQVFKRNVLLDLGWHKRTGLLYSFTNHGLKYVSGITLFVEKENTYTRV